MKNLILQTFLLLFVVCSLQAEVILRDFGTGIVIGNGAAQQLDLDEDGSMDFTFNPVEGVLGVTPFMGCFVRVVDEESGTVMVRAESTSDPIVGDDDEFEDFSDGEIHSASRGYAPGWADGEEHIMGIMFWTTNQFGWMKVVPNTADGTLRILEFALQTEVGIPIDITEEAASTTSINPMDIPTEIRTFPNPATSLLNLSFENTSSNDLEVKVYNSLGQEMYAEKVIDQITVNITIVVREWASGIYNLVMLNEDGVLESRTVMIQKE